MVNKETKPKIHMAGEAKSPNASRPWEDTTLSAKERYDSYKAVVREQCQRIYDAGTSPGVTKEERYAMSQDPENRMWKAEFEQIIKETPEEFCYRIDGEAQRELLGKNFLGAKEWKEAFGVDVGVVPPIPKAITKELLESECPFHPGQKIKDTHVLVLIPKTVDGIPYTARKLAEICSNRKNWLDGKLINDEGSKAKAWKKENWAKIPQLQSEWLLIPYSGHPEASDGRFSEKASFREKTIGEQQCVLEEHYKGYREVKAIELMTVSLLEMLLRGDETCMDIEMPCYRCKEPNALGGRICVGYFDHDGLQVMVDDVGVGGGEYHFVWLALARRL